MCGIVGFISKEDSLFQQEKQHFMHFALTLDTLRGFDSTGIISVRKRFEVRAQHSLMAGDRYVHSSHYKKAWQDSWAKIGHNRAATRGSTTLPHCHPFTFGPVCLVHNGTLAHNGSSLDTYDSKLKVDSMQIALALSKAEPGDFKKVLEQVEGSFALVWTDTRDESVNMCRNSDRPIHFTYNPAKNIIWFMSDGLHLKTVNKSLFKSAAEGGSIFSMDKMKVLKYRKGSLVPEVTAFAPFVRPVTPIVSLKDKLTARQKRQRNGSGKDKRSALERAVDRWGRAVGSRTSNPIDGTGLRITDMKTEVNGKTRKLLLKHLTELNREFDLKPNRNIAFRPVVKYQQVNGRYTILGDIEHPDWEDGGEWDAIIYNMRPAMANAYFKSKWMVNPVGLSRPHTLPHATNNSVPSVICDLVNCDWEKHKHEGLHEAQDEGKELSPILVIVGDREIEAGRLDKILADGCAGCAMNMSMDSIGDALIVNDGRDILCKDCVRDLSGANMDPTNSTLIQ